MNYFYYNKTAIEYLSNKDPILASEIVRIGHINREVYNDKYESLITQVIAQQVSKKAAVTVFNRLNKMVSTFNAINISKLSVENIQACGMTFRKANNISVISKMIVDNQFSLESLEQLSNEEVIKKMCELPGIGVWTAQMFMIFTLQRNNIISYGDLAIRQGMMKVYNLTSLSKKEFNEYEKIYDEYASVASLYLWYIAHE